MALLRAECVLVTSAASPVMQALSAVKTGTYPGRNETPPVIAMIPTQYVRGTVVNTRYVEWRTREWLRKEYGVLMNYIVPH